MLIDDGVLVPGEESWQLRMERLVPDRVPPTLTGVLQARLDALTAAERDVLQRAAVVGEQFWDGLWPRCGRSPAAGAEGLPAVSALLDLLEQKEMVVRQGAERVCRLPRIPLQARDPAQRHLRERAAAAPPHLPRGDCRAGWPSTPASAPGEYAALIASHHEQAGNPRRRRRWYLRAAQGAQKAFLPGEAIRYYQKALDYLPGGGDGTCTRAVPGLRRHALAAGAAGEAVAMYQAMRETAARGERRFWRHGRATTLPGSTATWGRCTRALASRGRLKCWRGALDKGGMRQRASGAGGAGVAVATQGWNYHGLGQPEEAIALGQRALGLARAAEKPPVIALALNLLGVAHTALGDHERGAHYGQEALELYRMTWASLGCGDHLQ
jgi:tetratricopeptide (TPR) repeat protein